MKIKLNNKGLFAIALISLGVATAKYVAIVNSAGSGGIVVVDEDYVSLNHVGSVAMWVTNTPPEGWIEMNGQSTSAYPELASIVGSNVPDLRGQFIRAWDNGKSVDPNRSLGTFQAQDFKGVYLSNNEAYSNYTHTSQYFKNVGSPEVGNQGLPTFGGDWPAPAGGIKLGFGNEEVRPTNYSIMYIIKTSSD